MKFSPKKIAVAAIAALTLTACGGVNLSSTQTALHYSGGAVQAQKFKDCVKPSSRDNFAPGDKFYTYQTDLRSFAATGGDKAESGPIEVLSKEKEVVRIPVTVAFNLKTDCKTLRDFHDTIGAKYSAYNNDKGVPGDGWRDLLNYAIGAPLNTTLDSLSEKQTFNDLIGNEEVRRALETAIDKNLPDQISKRTGSKQFFENFEIQVQKPSLANQAILDAIAGQNAAVEQGRAAEAKAKADGAAAIAAAEAARLAAAKNAQAAQAQVAVARAEAAKARAACDAYDSEAECNKRAAIDKGLNPYQPSYGGAAVAPAK